MLFSLQPALPAMDVSPAPFHLLPFSLPVQHTTQTQLWRQNQPVAEKKTTTNFHNKKIYKALHW